MKMKQKVSMKVLFISMLLIVPLQVKGQYYNIVSSEQYLRSGIILGSERETYQSYRVYTLGSDFANFIDDDISDLYRNPANFNTMKRAIVFGEYEGNFQKSSTSLSKYFYGSGQYPLYNSNPAKGLRVGYADNWGLMIRVKHASSDDNSTKTKYPSPTPSYDIPVYFRDETDTWKNFVSDVHFSYAFPLKENTSLGFDYTFSFDESPTGRNSQRVEFDIRDYTNSIDSAYYDDYSNNTVSNKNVSHIFRSGLSWGLDNKLLDVVTAVELQSEEISSNYENLSYRWSNTHRSDYVRDSYTEDNRVQMNLGTVDIQATILKLNLRYRNRLSETNAFIAHFGIGVSLFSSDDVHNYDNKSKYISELITDTSYSHAIKLSRDITVKNASPDGTGLTVNGGIVWNLSLNDAKLFIGSVWDFARFGYNYYEQWLREDTSIFIMPDTTINNRQYKYSNNDSYRKTYGILRAAIPVAIEYEVVENFQIRGGWKIEYLMATDNNSSSFLYGSGTTGKMVSSTPTIGFGWQVVQGLYADFINTGSITEANDWVVALQYKY